MTPHVTNPMGWHGWLVERPQHWPKPAPPLATKSGITAEPREVVYVRWQERENHDDPAVRREPVVSARLSELIDLR